MDGMQETTKTPCLRKSRIYPAWPQGGSTIIWLACVKMTSIVHVGTTKCITSYLHSGRGRHVNSETSFNSETSLNWKTPVFQFRDVSELKDAEKKWNKTANIWARVMKNTINLIYSGTFTGSLAIQAGSIMFWNRLAVREPRIPAPFLSTNQPSLSILGLRKLIIAAASLFLVFLKENNIPHL